MYKIVIYILSVITSMFTISGINFNGLFKQNHVWEARIFIIILSFIMGYLLGSFFIEFLSISAIF